LYSQRNEINNHLRRLSRYVNSKRPRRLLIEIKVIYQASFSVPWWWVGVWGIRKKRMHGERSSRGFKNVLNQERKKKTRGGKF
jgi:hypothetical protein